MLPTLYQGDAGLGVHTYGIFIVLAFVAAFLVTHTKSTAAGIHPMKLIPVYLAAVVGGLAGGRILFTIAVEPGLDGLLADPISLFKGSGYAVYGGFLGGTLAVAAVAIPSGIPPWKLADIAAPSVVMGFGVGRLGCFFAGCCHGAPAPVLDPRALLSEDTLLHGQIWLSKIFPFVAIEFHDGVGRIHDVPLYPTQLWEAGSYILVAATILALWDRRRFDGQMAAMALLLQPPFRILIEAFRADHRGYAFTFQVSEAIARRFPGMTEAGDALHGTMGLTTSQAIGIGMVLFGAMIYAARRNAGVEPETPLDPDAELD